MFYSAKAIIGGRSLILCCCTTREKLYELLSQWFDQELQTWETILLFRTEVKPVIIEDGELDQPVW